MAKVKADTTKRDSITFTKEDHDFYDEVASKTSENTAKKAFMARWAYLKNNGNTPEYKSMFQNHGVYFKDVNEKLPGSPGILVYNFGKNTKNKSAESGQIPINTYIGSLRARLKDQGMLQDVHRHFEARTGQFDKTADGMPDLEKVWNQIDANNDGMITGYDLDVDRQNGGKIVDKLKNVWKELKVLNKGGEIDHNLNVSFRSFQQAFNRVFINDISHGNVPMNLGRNPRQSPDKTKYPFGAWQPGAKATHIKTGLDSEIDSSKLSQLKTTGRKAVDSWFMSDQPIQTTIAKKTKGVESGDFITNNELKTIAQKSLKDKFEVMWPKVIEKIANNIGEFQTTDDPIKYYKTQILMPLSYGLGMSHAERIGKFRDKFDLGREVGGQGVNFDKVANVDGTIPSEDKIGVGQNVQPSGLELTAKEKYLSKIHTDFLRRPFDADVVKRITGYTPNSALSKMQLKKEMENYLANNKNMVLSSPEAKDFIANFVRTQQEKLNRQDKTREKFDKKNFDQSPISPTENPIPAASPPPKDTNVITPQKRKLSPSDISNIFQKLKARNASYASSDNNNARTAADPNDLDKYRKFGKLA